MVSNPSSRRAAPDRRMRTFPLGVRRGAERPQTALASRHFVERRLPWLRYTAEIFIGSSVPFTKSRLLVISPELTGQVVPKNGHGSGMRYYVHPAIATYEVIFA